MNPALEVLRVEWGSSVLCPGRTVLGRAVPGKRKDVNSQERLRGPRRRRVMGADRQNCPSDQAAVCGIC